MGQCASPGTKRAVRTMYSVRVRSVCVRAAGKRLGNWQQTCLQLHQSGLAGANVCVCGVGGEMGQLGSLGQVCNGMSQWVMLGNCGGNNGLLLGSRNKGQLGTPYPRNAGPNRHAPTTCGVAWWCVCKGGGWVWGKGSVRVGVCGQGVV